MILAPAVSNGLQGLNPLCVLSPAACIAQSAGGAAVHAVSSSVFDAFSSWLSNGASWLVGQVFNIVVGSDAPGSTNPVSVNLSVGWFEQKDSLMLTIAVLLLSPLLLAATIGAVLRQDLGRLAAPGWWVCPSLSCSGRRRWRSPTWASTSATTSAT